MALTIGDDMITSDRCAAVATWRPAAAADCAGAWVSTRLAKRLLSRQEAVNSRSWPSLKRMAASRRPSTPTNRRRPAVGRENPPAPGRRPEGSGSGRVRRRTLVDHPGGSPAPGPSRPAACLTAAAAERLIPVTVTLCPRCGQVAAGGPMQIKGGGPRAKPCAFAHPAWRGRGQARCVRAHGSVPGSPRTLACMRRPRRRSVMTSQTSIARSRTASLPVRGGTDHHPRAARRGRHRRPGAGQPGPSAAGRR